MFVFLLTVFLISIILTFVGRYIWYFAFTKMLEEAQEFKTCVWKTAFSKAILMKA